MEAICLICGVKFEKTSPNQKFCSNLCVKEYRKEYQKEYQKEYKKTDKNKEYQKEYIKTEKFKESKKKYQKNCRKNLSDLCIKNYLNMFDAPKELIEAKREQLKLFRLIKQMS
jgi:hypothetical protein